MDTLTLPSHTPRPTTHHAATLRRFRLPYQTLYLWVRASGEPIRPLFHCEAAAYSWMQRNMGVLAS